MIIYLGYLYVLFGILFLLIPIIYIELGRQGDLIKAGANFLIGLLLIFRQNFFNTLSSSILIFISILSTFYLLEIFSIRWNQLTDKEKNKLMTLVELKKNLLTLAKAISFLWKDFLNFFIILKFEKNNENIIKKKWVKNDENGNILNQDKKN